MKYSLITADVEQKSREITRKLRLSMNGITSDKLTNSGIVYKKNYGVSIPRIKEIATDYPKNHQLAQHLWKLSIRETMILATLIQPIEEFTPAMAVDWMSKFNQIEIIEQCSMNLLSKLPFAERLCCDCLESENDWQKITGFILAARIFKELKKENVNLILQKGLEHSMTDKFHLYKSIALCMSRMCRQNTTTALLIWEQISLLRESSSISRRYIYNEVEQELLFLEIPIIIE